MLNDCGREQAPNSDILLRKGKGSKLQMGGGK